MNAWLHQQKMANYILKCSTGRKCKVHESKNQRQTQRSSLFVSHDDSHFHQQKNKVISNGTRFCDALQKVPAIYLWWSHLHTVCFLWEHLFLSHLVWSAIAKKQIPPNPVIEHYGSFQLQSKGFMLVRLLLCILIRWCQ